MAKAHINRFQRAEAPYHIREVQSKEAVDATPDYFLPLKSVLHDMDHIVVFCPAPDGVWWERSYRVISTAEPVVAPMGRWKKLAKPEEEVKPIPEGRTAREVYVPVGCAAEDLDEHNYLKGDPFNTGDPLVKWMVKGLGTSNIYAVGQPDKETCLQIMKGLKPYRIEEMERAA